MNDERKPCVICRYLDATEFDDGYFHVANEDYPLRNCRELYVAAVGEINLRRVNTFSSMASVGYGWRGIVTALTLALAKTDPDYKIYQIKEKFGGLRFYVGKVGTVGLEMIRWAEAQSYSICEACGDYGSGREGGWLKTLCDDCNKLRAAGGRPWLENFRNLTPPQTG